MTAAGHGRRGVHAPSCAVALASCLVLTGAWPNASSAAAPASRPVATGQRDASRVATGQLRRALLPPAGTPADDRHPDARSTITIRSRFRVKQADAAVLLVEFRSRAGEHCLGLSVYRPGLVDAPECLRCPGTTCLFVVRGGALPDRVRVVAGTIDRRADEARVTDRHGAVRRYRVSRTRVANPKAAAPFLVETTGVRTVGAYRGGVRLEEVRFP